jgi:hypothetical protein
MQCQHIKQIKTKIYEKKNFNLTQIFEGAISCGPGIVVMLP